MAIEHALLRGDVRVDHPQMTLDSNELELSFAPADGNSPAVAPERGATKSTSTQIQQMIARENVRGRFVDPADPKSMSQSIDAKLLTVDFDKTADGRSFPQKAVATGAVRAGDGKSELRANYLEVTMSPSAAAQARHRARIRSRRFKLIRFSRSNRFERFRTPARPSNATSFAYSRPGMAHCTACRVERVRPRAFRMAPIR